MWSYGRTRIINADIFTTYIKINAHVSTKQMYRYMLKIKKKEKEIIFPKNVYRIWQISKYVGIGLVLEFCFLKLYYLNQYYFCFKIKYCSFFPNEKLKIKTNHTRQPRLKVVRRTIFSVWMSMICRRNPSTYTSGISVSSKNAFLKTIQTEITMAKKYKKKNRRSNTRATIRHSLAITSFASLSAALSIIFFK